FEEMIRGMQVNAQSARKAAADPMLLATDLADHLVLLGVPFRDAHEVVGRIVAHSLKTGRPLDEVPLEELRRFSKKFGAEAGGILNLVMALAKRKAPGAPSSKNVAARLRHWRKVLTAK